MLTRLTGQSTGTYKCLGALCALGSCAPVIFDVRWARLALELELGMSLSPSSIEQVLLGYFRAKDGNRPHLLDRVFSQDARLEVRNKSTAISFPAVTVGREAIAEVLVRRFGQTYENVYSFYLARPRSAAATFSCQWLVGMTEKEGKSVRVGCGQYEWSLQDGAVPCATSLVITIEAMQILPFSTQEAIFAWLEGLSYPWSTRTAVVASAPAVQRLADVLQCLS
jgi:hypothetical protein